MKKIFVFGFLNSDCVDDNGKVENELQNDSFEVKILKRLVRNLEYEHAYFIKSEKELDYFITLHSEIDSDDMNVKRLIILNVETINWKNRDVQYLLFDSNNLHMNVIITTKKLPPMKMCDQFNNIVIGKLENNNIIDDIINTCLCGVKKIVIKHKKIKLCFEFTKFHFNQLCNGLLEDVLIYKGSDKYLYKCCKNAIVL